MQDTIDRKTIVQQIRRTQDIANQDRCPLEYIRAALRQLEMFALTENRTPRAPSLALLRMSVSDDIPTFFDGRRPR